MDLYWQLSEDVWLNMMEPKEAESFFMTDVELEVLSYWTAPDALDEAYWSEGTCLDG